MGLLQGSPICMEGTMRQDQFTVCPVSVCTLTISVLLDAFLWTNPAWMVLMQFLVRAAAEMRSLSAVVNEAEQGPCYETVRKSILALLPGDPLQALPLTTRALHGRLPKGLNKRPRPGAIDVHLRPYYG